MSTPHPVGIVVTPEPTEDELAAIIVAYQELWPAPPDPAARVQSASWRFSGRWWTDAPMRRGFRLAP